MRWQAAIVLAGILVSAPVRAEEVGVDIKDGPAGNAAIVLARQTRSSIVIDSRLARRPVPPIRGRMEAAEAVERLAKAVGARAVSVAPSAWRIEPAPAAPSRRKRRAQSAKPSIPAANAVQPPPPPEPIIVEGSKRDLPLEHFAGAVSMLDGESLRFGGVGGTEKIAQRIATVASTHLGSGRNKLFIRGIADSSFTGPTQATVGQYMGDLRLSYNAPDPDLRLSDVERVEVLEGPQGALYGAGSLGGIIRIVPRMPKPIVEGSAMLGASITQHGAPGADASAMFNLPVTPSAALRVTLDAAWQGGYIDKPVLERRDVNRSRIFGGRAILRTELAPGVTVDLIGFGQTTRNHDSQYADRNGDSLTSLAAVREGSRADYAQGQLVVSADLGTVQLRSSTGLTWQDLRERYDATFPGGAPRLFEQTNDTRMFANETRIWREAQDGLGWLVGISYTRNDARLSRGFIEGNARANTTGVRNRISEATLYGEATVPLVPGLMATAGGRLTHSRLGGSGQDVSPLLAAARAEITASRSETRFLPSASLLANLRPGTSVYLRYEESFRPGGLAIEADFVRRFRNDHTATFEFGARHGRPDRDPFDVSLNLSYTRWKDIQADFIDASGLPSSANIGDGRVWSASLSGGVRAAPGLRLEAGATLNWSDVDRPGTTVLLPLLAAFSPGEQLEAFYGRTSQIPNVARFAGRFALTYERPIGDALDLEVRGWTTYVGRSRLGIGPELGELQGDYFDSGLDLRVGRGNAGLTLGVTNITNSRGNRFSLGTPFAVGREQVTPLRPRTVRLGLDARF